MNEREREMVEKEVLKVYQKVNPSTHLIENKDVFEEHSKIREILFRDKLKFPIEMFKGKTILDFGSGTGENCSFYLRWGGGELDCVEMNPISIERLKKMYSEWGLSEKTNVHHCSLLDFNSEKKFDLVTCDGVLNHINNPELGFRKLVSNLKEGGYVIISIGNSLGAFQRNLQKYALYKISNNEEEKIVQNAKILFSEHISRASQFGRRTPEAVIYDTYINPKTTNVSVSEVLRWFRENKIIFYSSWPPLQFPFAFTDSVNREPIRLESSEYSDLFHFTELFWLMANKYDSENIANNKAELTSLSGLGRIAEEIKDVTPEFALTFNLDNFLAEVKTAWSRISVEDLTKKYIDNLSKLSLEILDFLEILNITTEPEIIRKRIENYNYLFKGYCGLGEVFYAGYKQQPE